MGCLCAHYVRTRYECVPIYAPLQLRMLCDNGVARAAGCDEWPPFCAAPPQNAQLPTRYHEVGRPQADDVLLYVVEQPTWHQSAEVTDDGRCVAAWAASAENRGSPVWAHTLPVWLMALRCDAWVRRMALLLRTHRRTTLRCTAACTPTYSNMLHHRYLLVSISSGCEPTNRLYYVDLDALPRRDDGVIDFAAFAAGKEGSSPLPIVKLVDNFDAAYDYISNEGSVFTFHTNLDAPRYRRDGRRIRVVRHFLVLVCAGAALTPTATPTPRLLPRAHHRLVRTDLESAEPPEAWAEIIPQHPKDMLQWASALKVGTGVGGGGDAPLLSDSLPLPPSQRSNTCKASLHNTRYPRRLRRATRW